MRNGEIVETRDYMDVFGTYDAMGRLEDVVAAARNAVTRSGVTRSGVRQNGVRQNGAATA